MCWCSFMFYLSLVCIWLYNDCCNKSDTHKVGVQSSRTKNWLCKACFPTASWFKGKRGRWEDVDAIFWNQNIISDDIWYIYIFLYIIIYIIIYMMWYFSILQTLHIYIYMINWLYVCHIYINYYTWYHISWYYDIIKLFIYIIV